MVKHKTQRFTDEQNKPLDGKLSTLLDYASNSNPKLQEIKFNDDLILSLANAHENKRARQVFEWEIVRRKNHQQTI